MQDITIQLVVNIIKKNYAISIENVVASASIDQKIDLLAIMKVFRNVEYRPKQFPGLVFRLKRPKTATLIFGSGKMVCTGAKSEKMAISAVKKVVHELNDKGIVILGKPQIVIQNIVASANLRGKIDLETAAQNIGTNEDDLKKTLIEKVKKEYDNLNSDEELRSYEEPLGPFCADTAKECKKVLRQRLSHT